MNNCFRTGSMKWTFFLFPILLLLLMYTSSLLPLTWDEGDSMERVDALLRFYPGEGYAESRESLQCYPAGWNHVTRWEGHPAGYTELIALGKKTIDQVNAFFPPEISVGESISRDGSFYLFSRQGGFSPRVAWRFGPVSLFALALCCVFYRITLVFGRTAAFFAIGSILLIPRLFAHVHIAACDSPLISLWLISWSVFPREKASWPLYLLWGCVLGSVMSVKFTGWIVPVPFILFLVMTWKSQWNIPRRFHLILAAFCVALLTFFLLNPPLWPDPWNGIKTFLELNLSRKDYNIAICFLGKIYNLRYTLPWYNTMFWTEITMPLPLLLFIPITLVRYFGEKTFSRGVSEPNPLFPREVLLILLNAMTLLVIRSLPNTPVHDGVRLFIAVFPFLGILSGLGAAVLWNTKRSIVQKHVLRITIAIIYGGLVWNMYCYAPQWLSFYNVVIGGPRGALKAGMEPTYYWDSVDREVFHELNKRSDSPSDKVLFGAHSILTIHRYRYWQDLHAEAGSISQYKSFEELKDYRWYVLQIRQSGFSPFDIEVMKTRKPVFVKRVAGCPVLCIYDLKQR